MEDTEKLLVPDIADMVPIADAPALFPINLHPHIGTVTRWYRQGIGPAKTKLQTWRVGGRVYTTSRAVEVFIAALSANGGDS